MKILVGAILLIFALLLVMAAIIFVQNCGRRQKPPTPHSSPARPQMAQKIEDGKAWFLKQHYQIREITSFDTLKLKALYLPADGDTTLILMHGYYGDPLYEFAPQLEFWHRQGYNLLLPYQRAHGESEGKYLSFGIDESRDTAAWAEHINAADAPKHIFLFGISMGGATVAMSALRQLPENVRGIIADCPYGDPTAQFQYSLSHKVGLAAPIFLYLCSIWSRALAGWHFGNIFATDFTDATLPLLILHGTNDPTVPDKMSALLAEHWGGKVQRELFADCAHAYAYIKETKRYQRLVTDFMQANSPH